MNGRHRIPDEPIPGTGHHRATSIVQALTGIRVEDSDPVRHDGTQTRRASNPDEVGR